jgi:hypothetical protein
VRDDRKVGYVLLWSVVKAVTAVTASTAALGHNGANIETKLAADCFLDSLLSYTAVLVDC